MRILVTYSLGFPFFFLCKIVCPAFLDMMGFVVLYEVTHQANIAMSPSVSYPDETVYLAVYSDYLSSHEKSHDDRSRSLLGQPTFFNLLSTIKL